MRPGVRPIQTEIPQFEDVYGNKMDDLQWHAHVRDQLLNGPSGLGGWPTQTITSRF